MIRAVLKKSGVKPGGTILDAGCGQGQFSRLLASPGYSVVGVDLSEVGIAEARRHAGPREQFIVGDISEMTADFDAVFCRSFSPYNTADFSMQNEWTVRLLGLVRPGGVLIWCYNSCLAPSISSSWRQHTLDEARQHFRAFEAEVFFTMRLECRLGSWVLNRLDTRCAEWFSHLTGRGGELIAIVRKSQAG
ncbi:MAG TPA: methyltransferase domain-containing protein [Opitutus sp.]|nr:methyltransferase domain-containing protein [Opitutus sp.]